jgi:addiction module RelB/DinJ family antitoxin
MTMRVDENLKRKADELFADLGMNMTTAVTIFLKQALRKQGIPFSILYPVIYLIMRLGKLLMIQRRELD